MKKFVSIGVVVCIFASLLVAGVAVAQEKTYKVAFIMSTMAHSVPAAWHEGIKRLADTKPYIEYEAADGEWRVDVQIAKNGRLH